MDKKKSASTKALVKKCGWILVHKKTQKSNEKHTFFKTLSV
nr:MAG TPA: hypothetical protein [Caudoviricetes sp.]